MTLEGILTFQYRSLTLFYRLYCRMSLRGIADLRVVYNNAISDWQPRKKKKKKKEEKHTHIFFFPRRVLYARRPYILVSIYARWISLFNVCTCPHVALNMGRLSYQIKCHWPKIFFFFSKFCACSDWSAKQGDWQAKGAKQKVPSSSLAFSAWNSG